MLYINKKLFIFRYDEQEEVVDMVFPLIGYNDYDPEFEIQKFSSFGFWRETLLDIAQFT